MVKKGSSALTAVFAVVCIVYVMPILLVLMNSFKNNNAINSETFAFPNEETFVGIDNFIKGMTFGNYPFMQSVFNSLVITTRLTAASRLVSSPLISCISRRILPTPDAIY